MTGNAGVGYWPSWASTWYGRLFRVLVAFWGAAVGAVLVGGGYFSGVNWKTGEESWILSAVLLVLGGIAFAIFSLVGALRPTKVTFLPTAGLFIISIAGGAAALVAEWVRSLA